MGQFLGENIPYLVKDSSTQISLPATYLGQPTRLQIMGQGYKLNSALVLSTATVGLGGLDAGSLAANTLYYVYAVVSSNVVGLVASVNAPSVGPTGFTQWRQIGRMRTFSGSAALAVVVNNFAGNGGPAEAQEVTEWVSYTPIVGSISIDTTKTIARYRRVGSYVELDVQVTANGTASGYISISLPSNLTGNYSTSPQTFNVVLGSAAVAAGAAYYTGTTVYQTNNNNLSFYGGTSGLYSWGTVNPKGSALASGDVISFRASISIVEFQGLFS